MKIKFENDTVKYVLTVIVLVSFMFGMGFANCVHGVERSHADVSISHIQDTK